MIDKIFINDITELEKIAGPDAVFNFFRTEYIDYAMSKKKAPEISTHIQNKYKIPGHVANKYLHKFFFYKPGKFSDHIPHDRQYIIPKQKNKTVNTARAYLNLITAPYCIHRSECLRSSMEFGERIVFDCADCPKREDFI